MRKMGEGASVPIEPPEQTKLLDVCVTQAGVIGGGIPGGERTASPFAMSF
jgi:phosphomevalonate kinase